jgi:uncharacterized protein (TIGR00725 family)
MSFNFKDKFKGTISVIGASEIDEQTRQVAVELGRLLARNKYAVSCGGLSGVMEAVCFGVKEEGGLTIGLIPFIDKNKANKYVDIVIPIPFSQARNVVVVLKDGHQKWRDNNWMIGELIKFMVPILLKRLLIN